MTVYSYDEIVAFAARHGLAWATPPLLEQLHRCAENTIETARATPRMDSEYDEPAHIFVAPG